MPRLGNALLVGAVGAVVLVAAVDALREGEQRAPRPVQLVREEVARALPPAAARFLGRAEVSGRLVFSDAECRRRAVRLPDLARRALEGSGCGVFSDSQRLCVRHGQVSRFVPPLGTTPLVSRAQLARALGRPPGALGSAEPLRASSFAFRSVAWLGGTRYAALVVGPGIQGELLALFVGSRLERVLAELSPGYAEVRSSPRGRWFAAVNASGGIRMYAADGRAASLARPLAGGHSIAWSLDERWAAVATRDAVILFTTTAPGVPLVSLPIDALDLDWDP